MDIDKINVPQIKRQFDAIRKMRDNGVLSETEFHEKLGDIGVQQRGDHFEYVGPEKAKSSSRNQGSGTVQIPKGKSAPIGGLLGTQKGAEIGIRKASSVGIPLGLDEPSAAARTGGKTAPGAVGPNNLDLLRQYAEGGPGLLGNTTGQ